MEEDSEIESSLYNGKGEKVASLQYELKCRHTKDN